MKHKGRQHDCFFSIFVHRVENVATHGGQLSPALSSGLTGAWGTLVATPECIPC